ncbi:MAG TPA: TraR/DksA C4-type zinc finger protein [Anaeromyxobacter sp.]|nr:TraR/DksA C4-type zinc finger protein [Anaeromyxobacter sp.]
MDPQSLEWMRRDLERRRSAIQETQRLAHAELEALRAAERDPEMEEGAQAEHEQYTLARLTEAQRGAVEQIDAALARMARGEFGTCADCEQEIDPRRLAALPTTVLCGECARRREQDAVRIEQAL